MRNKSAAFFVTAFLLLCLASSAFGQVETTVTRKKALLGVTNPKVQGNRILVGDDSNVSVSDVVLLEVKSDYKFQRVRARVSGNRVEPEKLADNVYLFAGAGAYVVEVTVFDPDKGIDDAEIKFEIGGKPKPPTPDPTPDPEPEPEPEPKPDIVPNDYGVGQLTYDMAPADAANAAKFAAAYRNGAGQLFGVGGQLRSIDRILADLKATVDGRQCADLAKCAKWGEWKTKLDAAIKAEQTRRGSFSRDDWFAALNEIAKALEARQ
jgi:hypothetical protein